MKKEYQLTRDNIVLFIGTENECYYKLQRVQGHSADWAIKYEGYKVEKITQDKN
jgi:hypothetical protein